MPRGSISGTEEAPKVVPPADWNVRVPNGVESAATPPDEATADAIRPTKDSLFRELRERLAAVIKPD